MFFIWDGHCSEESLTEESHTEYLWAVHSNFPKLPIKMNCTLGTPSHQHQIKAGEDQISDVHSFVCYSGGGTEGMRVCWSVLLSIAFLAPVLNMVDLNWLYEMWSQELTWGMAQTDVAEQGGRNSNEIVMVIQSLVSYMVSKMREDRDTWWLREELFRAWSGYTFP